MLFNSYDYLIFLPIIFILYWIFKFNFKIQNYILLFASYFFYGWWSWKFLFLLFSSTLLDYLYGFVVDSDNRKRASFFLWLSIVNNVGLLFLFKYYDFFAKEFSSFLYHFNINTNPLLLNWVLPIGISFYTFHGMSYVFDIYNKKRKPISSFSNYALFVSFFPLLVAGPIERSNHLLPQIQSARFLKYSKFIEGSRLILWGMFKKVVIADGIVTFVDQIFSSYQFHNSNTLITGAIGFSFQIYCDFSGYTDIALGTAKLFGFELLTNFKFPYFAKDLSDFWRKWHISLSSWFRDYLYFPLGGSKFGILKSIRNTFIIFLVSGFWHGASWNYILWGFIHACGFMPLLISGKNKINSDTTNSYNKILPSFYDFYKMSITFIFVTIAWIFFRMNNTTDAFLFIKNIFWGYIKNPISILDKPYGGSIYYYIIPFVIIEWTLRRDERLLRLPKNIFLRIFIYIFVTLLIFSFFDKSPNSFIYFQF